MVSYPPKFKRYEDFTQRIHDLTVEIEVKDSMMADIIARQDELQITELQSLNLRKRDLFPEEDGALNINNSESSVEENLGSAYVEDDQAGKMLDLTTQSGQLSKDSISDATPYLSSKNELYADKFPTDAQSISPGSINGSSTEIATRTNGTDNLESVLLTISQAKESISRKNSAVNSSRIVTTVSESDDSTSRREEPSTQELEHLFQSCIESIEGKLETKSKGFDTDNDQDKSPQHLDSTPVNVSVNGARVSVNGNPFEKQSNDPAHSPVSIDEISESQTQPLLNRSETTDIQCEKEEGLKGSVKRFGVQIDQITVVQIAKVINTPPKTSLPLAPQLQPKIRDRSVTLNTAAPTLGKKAPILKSRSDLDKSAVPTSLLVSAPLLKSKDSVGNYPLTAAPVLVHAKGRAPHGVEQSIISSTKTANCTLSLQSIQDGSGPTPEMGPVPDTRDLR
jgi:hypothetical protein